MTKNIHEWIQKVGATKPTMVELAAQLRQKNVVVELDAQTRACDSIPFVATFSYNNGVETNIFFELMDYQTDSDVVITNMTTLPENTRGNGFGSQAVQTLLLWAKKNNLHEIQATQVGDPNSRRFWEKNGFVRCPEPNPCGDYVYRC